MAMSGPDTKTAQSGRHRGLIAAAGLLAAVLLAAVSLAACGQAAGTASVAMKDLLFQPQVLTVPVGTTVTWTNDDFESHTVTSDAAKLSGTSYSASPAPNVFASQPIDPGDSYSFTFRTPGTYPYHDEIHGYETGTVIVK
jgi:plastocyanin